MSTLSANALKVAYDWHQGQTRKYDGMPYIVHPVDVAARLQRAYDKDPRGDFWLPNIELVLSAAHLHDVVEDCGVTHDDFAYEFGEHGAEALWSLVMEVTQVSKPSDGNRKIRKKLDQDHYAKSSPAGATIKLADMISNAVSVKDAVSNGHKQAMSFMPVYFAELCDMVQVLKHGHPDLWAEANEWVRG